MKSKTLFRTILASLLILTSMTCCVTASQKGRQACPGKANTGIYNIIEEYRGESGLHVINVGSFGMSLARHILNKAASECDTPEEAALISELMNLKGITIVEYEDCSDKVKAELTRGIDKAFAPENILLDVKDGEDRVKICGILDEKADKVSGLALSVSDDCVLILFRGSISVDALSSAIASSDKDR